MKEEWVPNAKHPDQNSDLTVFSLGLHGNQLNYIVTAWTCGYVLGQVPSKSVVHFESLSPSPRLQGMVVSSSQESVRRCGSPPWN